MTVSYTPAMRLICPFLLLALAALSGCAAASATFAVASAGASAVSTAGSVAASGAGAVVKTVTP